MFELAASPSAESPRAFVEALYASYKEELFPKRSRSACRNASSVRRFSGGR